MRYLVCTLCSLMIAVGSFAQNLPRGNASSSKPSNSTQSLTCSSFNSSTYYYEGIALQNIVSDALTLLLNHSENNNPTLKEATKQLLQTPHVQIVDNELGRLTKVKSTQISEMGIFDYPYFNCKFTQKGGDVYYRKTSGSQRQNGYIYKVDEKTRYFLGAWSVNDEPLKEYNSDQSILGAMFKLSSGKYIMIIVESRNSYNILEFK